MGRGEDPSITHAHAQRERERGILTRTHARTHTHAHRHTHTHAHPFQILCDNRTWTLRAHDESDKFDWISAIRAELPAENIKMSGYLEKKGEKKVKSRRRRWFELSGITLAYYDSKVCILSMSL